MSKDTEINDFNSFAKVYGAMMQVEVCPTKEALALLEEDLMLAQEEELLKQAEAMAYYNEM